MSKRRVFTFLHFLTFFLSYFKTTYKEYGESLIIDNGSGMLKIGLSNQEKPTHVPNIVGTENYQVLLVVISIVPTYNEKINY